MPKLKSYKIGFSIGNIIKIDTTWEPNQNEKKAAWEMLVELCTRITTIELKHEEGLLREALNSIYSLFSITRMILRKYGPSVAKNKGKRKTSFGVIAISILNTTIRPLLAKWHPLLLDYESKKMDNISIVEHEKNWERNNDLRNEIIKVRKVLVKYSNLLAKVAGVPPLIAD